LPVTVPDVAVIVIVVPAVTPAADRLAVMVPFAAVVAPAPERVPALAPNVTATPVSALLLASFASTVMVAVPLPSAGRVATVLVTVSDATFDVPPLLATLTVVFPETVPAVAVTVIAVPAATPDAVSEVVAWPLVLVVAVLAERVPALVENDTVAFETAAPVESVTTAVIVAPAEPSPGIVAVVALTATVAGVPVLVPVVQPVVVAPVPPVNLSQPLLPPPHPAKARSENPSTTTIEAILRIFLT
jgi:hypothetical protein